MKRIIFFTVLGAILIVFHFFGVLNPIENIIIKTATPIGNIFRGSFNYFNDSYQKYLSGRDIEEENKRLRERVKELIKERVEINLLREENTSFKNMLSFLEDKKYGSITARIIGKTTEGGINTIIINRGEKDGVMNNLPVIAENGVLIGKIIKVTPFTSTILLISDGNSNVAGMIQNKNKTVGIVKGGYGLGVRMELVPQNEIIETDEIVITSGLELEIPKGLLIGTVESVIREPRTPFQTITIKALLEYEKLDFVSVLIP
ncbi:MAG: rod shape-determining protein MreC [Parcubacteria group bacterium]|nr:rod shape-determining protein MreC [Parcubacteria group bacterium]